jgi:guanosine-3',5'-bis(diphosphate) 3'-pyrophosphohydrolase
VPGWTAAWSRWTRTADKRHPSSRSSPTKNQHPSQDWLRIATTNRARSKIRRWLKERRWHESRDLGEEIFRKELERNQIASKEVNTTDLAQSMGFKGVEHLFAAIGAGDVTLPTVMRKLLPENGESAQQTSVAPPVPPRRQAQDTAQRRAHQRAAQHGGAVRALLPAAAR